MMTRFSRAELTYDEPRVGRSSPRRPMRKGAAIADPSSLLRLAYAPAIGATVFVVILGLLYH